MTDTKNFFAALNDDSDDGAAAVSNVIATKKDVSQERAKTLKKAPNVRKAKETKQAAVQQSKPVAKSGGGGGSSRGNHHKRAPKREFDRRSGTGRGREGKKDGAGGHNWGKAGVESAAEILPGDVVAEDVEEVPATEEEPKVKELTLEEYEQQLKEKRQGDLFAQVQVRKGEQIKEGVKYAKKSASELENVAFIAMGEKKEKKKTQPTKTNNNKKKAFDTDFKIRSDFAPSSDYGGDRRRGGLRGGRGGFRGRGGAPRGGAGGGRGGRRAAPVVPMNDPNSFPSLSSVAQQ